MPQEARTNVCTDVCCGFFFYAWLAGMGAIQYYAVQNGNLDKLTHGFNWQNEICGVSERVVDRPYLYWCPPENGSSVGWDLADGICLPSCPREGGSQPCPGRSQQFHLNISDGNGNFIITTGRNRTLTPRASYDSTLAGYFCVPDANTDLAASFAEAMASTGSVTAAFEGIRESKVFFSGVAIFALILGYVYFYLLRHFLTMLMKILVVVVGLGLLIGGAGFLYLGNCASTDDNDCDPAMMHMLDGFVSRDNLPTVGYAVGGTLSVLFLLYCAMMCCMRDSFGHIIDALNHACELMTKMPTLILQPAIQTVFKLSVLSGLVMGMCWIVSLGEPTPVVISEAGASVQGVGRKFEFTDNQFYALCFFAFGCVWLLETITALGQYVMSHVVVSQKENHTDFKLPLLHGYMNCFKYHIGTIAFGGFVLGTLRIVSAIMALFMKLTQKEDGSQNMCVKIVCCCCLCCMECVTDAVELLNELVYTDVAITGSSYMTAAKNVVAMAASNPATYGGVKLATEVLGFLGTFSLSFVGTYVPYQVLVNPGLFGANQVVVALSQQSQTGVTIVAFLISFFISMGFMTTFNQLTLANMYVELSDEKREKDQKEEEGYSQVEGTGTEKP